MTIPRGYLAARAPGAMLTGGKSAEQRAYGDFLGKDERYARTAEFLDIVTSLWRGETVTRDGMHLKVDRVRLSRLPDPVPDVCFGGSSQAAGQAAGPAPQTSSPFAPVSAPEPAAAS